jgi:acyl carrier protein
MSLRDQLVAQLGSILVKCVGIQVPNPALSAEERLFGGRLGLDSVDAAQWVATVERQYEVSLADSELIAGALENLGNLADVLIRRGVSARDQVQ